MGRCGLGALGTWRLGWGSSVQRAGSCLLRECPALFPKPAPFSRSGNLGMGVQPYKLLLSGLPLGCVASSCSPSLPRGVGELGLRAELDPKNQPHLSCIRAHVASWGMGCALCWQRLPLGKSEQPLSLQVFPSAWTPPYFTTPCSNPEEGQCQRMFKLPYIIALISYPSKVMLKILQARLQQCMNRERPDV